MKADHGPVTKFEESSNFVGSQPRTRAEWEAFYLGEDASEVKKLAFGLWLAANTELDLVQFGVDFVEA